ncbi:hypothetical protein [Luteibacter sp.]|uniref:hypothetical protein n=1 Tax=Luteibacter sp. TaxID=1886636 RepID=UPI002808ED43|nr:hypothetical protein [Luteibacter sp.]MDQ8049301.1 hypothetical protein [Luteibacter sp.]
MNRSFHFNHSMPNRGMRQWNRRRCAMGLAFLLMLGAASTASSADVSPAALNGRWAMHGVPAEAGESTITVIQSVDGNHLRVTPPRDLADATGGPVVLEKVGDGVFRSSSAQQSSVVVTFKSEKSGHLEIARDKRGQKVNFALDIERLN